MIDSDLQLLAAYRPQIGGASTPCVTALALANPPHLSACLDLPANRRMVFDDRFRSATISRLSPPDRWRKHPLRHRPRTRESAASIRLFRSTSQQANGLR